MIFSRPSFFLLSNILVAGGSIAFAAPTPAPAVTEESLVPPVTLPAPKPAKEAVSLPKIPKVAAAKVAKSSQPSKVSQGSKITRPFRLIVPAMGLDIPVVSGTDNDALRLAPGHDPLSALPGEAGNCVVASHRNVHGAYFWYLTKVTPGSLITLQTPRDTFTYKVVSARLVPESQTDLLENHTVAGAAERLTLYTCTLPVSPRRFVVVAHRVARGVKSPGAFGRPAVVPEITSGPLRLLKDKTLHQRYKSLLRYAQKSDEAAPLLPIKATATAAATP